MFPGGTFSPGSASHATADGLNGYGHDVEGDKDLEVHIRVDKTVFAAVLIDHSI